MGLTHLVIASTGEKQGNPRFLKRTAANLRRKQQSLSRKKKGSANRNKARVLVAKAHERVANARNDFQQKLSRRLVDENQAICVETLQVANMLKNRRLSKALADAAWGELVRKLDYKATWEASIWYGLTPGIRPPKPVAIAPRKWRAYPCRHVNGRAQHVARSMTGTLTLR